MKPGQSAPIMTIGSGPNNWPNGATNIMKNPTLILSALVMLSSAGIVQAGGTRDCMLEGTVHKSGTGAAEDVQIRFRSAKKYDEDARCRVRRGEKLEFQLPQDPRLEKAPSGASVKYRYREDDKGNRTTELISVGTSA
jgi:hypothetical protein